MFTYCLNNPIVYTDISGTYAESAENIVDLWAATMWWLCVVDTVLPIGDAVYVAGLVGLGALCATTMTGSQAETKAEAKAETIVVPAGDSNQTYYTVYFLYAAEDPSCSIIYVGRVKTANYAARMAYHRGRGRIPAAQIDGLTYEECRYLEQAGMVYYHTIGRGEPYKNQIRGISPLNRNRHDYINAGHKLIGSRFPENLFLPPSYLQNLLENELLNGGY